MQAYIIGMVLFISFIVGGHIAQLPKTSNGEITPTPILELIPTHEPIPTNKPSNNNQVKGSSTVTSNLIDCIGPDGKQFKTSEIECKKFNEAWGKKVTNYQAPTKTNQNTNISNYPPCTIYYQELKYSRTYYISPEACIEWKKLSENNTTTLITCVVSYPCKGTSDTYQVDQNTCNFMQSGAESTCSTYDAIKQMQEIGSKNYDYPQAKPIDGTIHTDPTPTCRLTPYGCY